MDNSTHPIQATFEHGVFRPTTPVTLPEGCQVQLSVVSAGEPTDPTPSDTTKAGSSIEEQLRQLAGDIPAESWNQLPADLSDRIDHYVYGVE
jgi:predicted DNA-binding antitoxin AbrB/MazE fold protein